MERSARIESLDEERLGEYNLEKWVVAHDELWGYSNERSIENLLHYTLALAEEVCEVSEVVTEGKYSEALVEELVDVMIYVQKLKLQLDIRPWELSSIPIIRRPRDRSQDLRDERDHLVTVTGKIAGTVKKHVRALGDNNSKYINERAVRDKVVYYLAIIVDTVTRMLSWGERPSTGPFAILENAASTRTMFTDAWCDKFAVLHGRWGEQCTFEDCAGSKEKKEE